MTDLKTTFAGLSLRNPIIISSSGLTNSAGKNKRLAEAGAGAIVLKPLFEEQIMLEADQLKDPAFYPEASDYLEEYIREHKLAEYLTLIKESKKECSISHHSQHQLLFRLGMGRLCQTDTRGRRRCTGNQYSGIAIGCAIYVWLI